ncbi:hypothetical protein [Candidatus Electronema sp. JM]|uniref:hypothetical protein n=1 Tax=Candidatus Electronema sp. JM TaxID=3401571 RepID=UPI003AA93E5D
MLTARKEQKSLIIDDCRRLRKRKKGSMQNEKTSACGQSKLTTRNWLLIVGVLLLSLFLFLFLKITIALVRDKTTLAYPNRITKETGLTLPKDATILATTMNTLTIADGPNYSWLFECKLTDIVTWISTTNGYTAPENWGDTSFIDQKGKTRKLHSVWRSVQKMPDGQYETAYLFVDKERKISSLDTFRP